jgi:hypothetical protein
MKKLRSQQKEGVMDPIAVLIVLTFIALLATSGLAFSRQRLPSEKHVVSCPQDHRTASVLVSWNPIKQEVCILGCDHPELQQHECHEQCRPQLESAFPTRVSSIVLP